MIRLAAELDPEVRALRKRFEDQVEGVERESYAKIAAAMFAIHGEDQYPHETFTLSPASGTPNGHTRTSPDCTSVRRNATTSTPSPFRSDGRRRRTSSTSTRRSTS